MVISNTSPLLALHRIDQFELLHQVLGEILVPEAVHIEIEESRALGYEAPQLEAHSWLQIQPAIVPQVLSLIPDLGAGEAAALALGMENPEALLILDDTLARNIAKAHGLKHTGTVGVLVKARQMGLLEKLRPSLDALVAAEFHLSEGFVEKLLQAVGEE